MGKSLAPSSCVIGRFPGRLGAWSFPDTQDDVENALHNEKPWGLRLRGGAGIPKGHLPALMHVHANPNWGSARPRVGWGGSGVKKR